MNKKYIADRTDDPTINQILFISIKLKKNSSDKITVHNTQIKITDGKIKNEQNYYSGDPRNYILCSIVNNNNNELKQFKIDNPLFRMVEFVDKDGQLGKKIVESSEGWINIRTRYNEDFDKIKITLSSDGVLTLIDKVKIEK